MSSFHAPRRSGENAHIAPTHPQFKRYPSANRLDAKAAMGYIHGMQKQIELATISDPLAQDLRAGHDIIITNDDMPFAKVVLFQKTVPSGPLPPLNMPSIRKQGVASAIVSRAEIADEMFSEE